MPPPPPPATLADGAAGGLRAGAPAAPTSANVAVAIGAPFWRKLAAFSGPGYLVAVGYMDPGNWATNVAAGSRYGYALLWVIVLSNGIAMLLQSLAAKLGIVTGMDLAQLCRQRYAPPTRTMLWLLAEAAIIACDLAEVLGTAIALQLLFGMPLVWGVGLTALNVVIATALEMRGFRKLEALIIAMMALVAVSLGTELVLAGLDPGPIARGLIPSAQIVSGEAVFLAAGILGATVMPHNLYLHSAVVQARRFGASAAEKRETIRFATVDSIVALGLAMLINAAILILAAAAFHSAGRIVTDLGEAYRLLAPALGTGLASILFGVALLVSGQNSTLTGTIAGQIVMEGFTDLRLHPLARRIVARAIAIVPAMIVATLYGGEGVGKLLIFSQVLLSLQLPFAVVPLVAATSDRATMHEFANSQLVRRLAWALAGLIIGINAMLLGALLL